MWCALGPVHIKRSNHALCASWTRGIELKNCACDCPLSVNHFCINTLWPTGTPNTTSPRSSCGPSPVDTSAPTVSKSSRLILALFQILVFPRLIWIGFQLTCRETARRVAEDVDVVQIREEHLTLTEGDMNLSELRAGPGRTTLA